MDAASTIDYSKEPLDGVVDSPPPKKILCESPSPLPLKGLERNCVRAPPSHPVGVVAPQRRLRMNARPTKSGPLHVPMRNALPIQSNLDASAPCAKVLPRNSSLSFYLKNERVIYLCLGLSPQTNPSFVMFVEIQVASSPKPLQSSANIELERYHSMCRIKDSPRRRIQILRFIIRAVDGIQNVLWWALLLTKATIARRGSPRMLKPCEQKNWRQKKKKQSSRLDRPS